MYIIEFIGPAGSGKTTLALELCKKNKFIHQSFLVFIKNQKIALLLQKIADKYPLAKKIIKEICNIMELVLIGRAKYLLHPKSNIHSQIYFSYFFSLLNDDILSAQASKRLRYFLKSSTIQNLAILSNSTIMALIDEGLAQRGISLAQASSKNDFLEHYYSNTPLPDILIHIDLNVNSLRTRIIKRNGESSNFLQNIDKMIEISNLCKTIYQNRGCKCLTINGENHLTQNVDIILEFLKNQE